MERNALLDRLRAETEPWDILVIGGGATGLGTAVDSAARGYRTLLLEQHDFGKGTSSRSTKLIHGGVRYMRQGQIALVVEALRERRLLLRNAPHLVHVQPFVVPGYAWWNKPFYGLGLKLYDALAGRNSLPGSRFLGRSDTLSRLPTLNPARLRGGVLYHDCVFDDARLAVTLAQTAVDLGGVPLNYAEVRALRKTNGRVSGAVAADVETGEEHEFRARAVVNATGVFEHVIRKMDEPDSPPLTTCSQGTHVVLGAEFLPGENAIMVPSTDDGRVLFAIPWLGRIVLGTTDVPVESRELEPRPLEGEVEFILRHAERYLDTKPGPSDALSVFTGLRPLGRTPARRPPSTISRDYSVHVSESGLVTMVGGKWTTFRRMGEVAVDKAVEVAGLDERRCRTKAMPLHGCTEAGAQGTVENAYGTDADAVRRLATEDPQLDQPLHPELPYHGRDVIWGVREEMARTVEDVLARRTRSLLLNARASMEAAPVVARLMAREMGHGETWIRAQCEAFVTLAQRYVP